VIRVQVLNADSLAAQIGRDLGRQLATALEHLGQETVEHARSLISTTVQESGRRSEPGEYPRKDTGKLAEGITYTVKPEGDGYTLLVVSERDGLQGIPRWLLRSGRLNWMTDTGRWLVPIAPKILVKNMEAAAQ
jgi:hypothetical protein